MEFTPRDTSVPLSGCNCSLCEAAREEQAKARPVSPFAFNFDLSGFNKAARSFKLPTVPFEPEPQPEPVYTHVLVDYDEDGPIEYGAELHTAESLIGAIKNRKDQDCRYQVFELGESILDCTPLE